MKPMPVPLNPDQSVSPSLALRKQMSWNLRLPSFWPEKSAPFTNITPVAVRRNRARSRPDFSVRPSMTPAGSVVEPSAGALARHEAGGGAGAGNRSPPSGAAAGGS